MSRLGRTRPASSYKLVRPIVFLSPSATPVSDSDSIQESENFVLGIIAVDSSIGSDVSGTLVTAVSSSDSSLSTESPFIALSDGDSSATSDSSVIAVSLSNSEGTQGSENSIITLITNDVFHESENQILGVSGNDVVQGSDVAVNPGVNVSNIEVVRLADDQLGSRMAYKFSVSKIPADVGIQSILELEPGIPELTLIPAGITAISGTDSSTGSESNGSLVIAVSSVDSSTSSDSSSLVAALASSETSTGSQSVPAIGISSTESSTGNEGTTTVAIGIFALENSVGAESSSLNIITTDHAMTSDLAMLQLFPSDSDHFSLTENQNTGIAIGSADSSAITENQSVTTITFISSSDNALGTDVSVSVADATSDSDVVRLSGEQNILSINIIDADISALTESSLLAGQVSDSDHSLANDDQVYFFNDSDSCVTQDFGFSSVDQFDSDRCMFQSENNFFGLESSLVVEWAVYPHLNQVVFAQPINQ